MPQMSDPSSVGVHNLKKVLVRYFPYSWLVRARPPKWHIMYWVVQLVWERCATVYL